MPFQAANKQRKMSDAYAWVDGSGWGGWGAVVVTDDKFVHVCAPTRGKPHSTRVELQAIIGALKYIKEPCEVMLYTDQAAVVERAKEWTYLRQQGKQLPVPKASRDCDLWEEFREQYLRHKGVTVCKVKSGEDLFHNMADGLASSAGWTR